MLKDVRSEGHFAKNVIFIFSVKLLLELLLENDNGHLYATLIFRSLIGRAIIFIQSDFLDNDY